MKLTALRQTVFDLINRNKSPQSARHIFEHLKDTTTLSSLYRALDYLEKHGLIQGFNFFNGIRYYAPAQTHTHYLICENCHEIIPFDNCSAGSLEKSLETNTGYHIEKHVLTFFGLCPECSASLKKQKQNKKKGL